VAALLSGRLSFARGQTVVVVVSGGNVDPSLLIRLTEYGLAHTGRFLVFRARMPDRPGELSGLLRPLAELRVNVVSVEHHRAAWGLPVDASEVMVQVEVRGPEHHAEVLAALRARGFAVEVVWPTVGETGAGLGGQDRGRVSARRTQPRDG
jgi:threonine dehydratase